MLRKNLAILSLLSLNLMAISAFAMNKDQTYQIKAKDKQYTSYWISELSKTDINNEREILTRLVVCASIQQKLKKNYKDNTIEQSFDKKVIQEIKKKCKNNDSLFKKYHDIYQSNKLIYNTNSTS